MKDEPAFPSNLEWTFDGKKIIIKNGGLSKREYFAALAMQGLLSNSRLTKYQHFPEDAVKCADALIEALQKGNERE